MSNRIIKELAKEAGSSVRTLAAMVEEGRKDPEVFHLLKHQALENLKAIEIIARDAELAELPDDLS